MKVLTQAPASQEPFESYVGVERVAAFLGRSKNFVYEQSHKSMTKPIPCLRRGKYLFFKLSQVERWLEETAQKV